MEKIKGLIKVPFTPFYENSEVNYEPIAKYGKLLSNNGVKGSINGPSGKGYLLTEEGIKLTKNGWELHDKTLKLLSI